MISLNDLKENKQTGDWTQCLSKHPPQIHYIYRM